MAMILLALLLAAGQAHAQAPTVRIDWDEDWLEAAAALAETQGQPWPAVDDLLTWAPGDRWSMKALTVPTGRVHETPTSTLIRWTQTEDGRLVPVRIGTAIYPSRPVEEPSMIWLFAIGGLALVLVPMLRTVVQRLRLAKGGDKGA